jgi:hypothetical protein
MKGLLMVIGFICSIVGLYFQIGGQWHEASIGWNAATFFLWAALYIYNAERKAKSVMPTAK